MVQINSVPWISDPESKIKETKYELSTADLARVVHAYFQAIAERPWVSRYGQFGYTHWENPLATELSVRGKPAEDVWQRWNKHIFGSMGSRITLKSSFSQPKSRYTTICFFS